MVDRGPGRSILPFINRRALGSRGVPVDATRVSSLAGPASNDTSIQPWQNHHEWSRHSRVDADRDGDHGEGDRFTSSRQGGSGQDAEDAGLFTVNSVSFFSAAATFFLAQTSPSSAGQASTATTSAPSASSNSTASTSAPVTPVVQSTTAAPATSASVDATSPANTQVTPVTQPPTVVAPVSTPTVSGSTTATTADSGGQNPLQALNNSLVALGLNQQEIQAFDQIATFIQAVSPAAFADLVSGLQALAQQVTQAAATAAPSTQSDSTAAAPSSSGSASDSASTSASAVPAASTGTTSTGAASAASASSTSAAPAASATPASSSGVQIEELVVQFSEVQVQGTVNSPATGSQGSNATSGTQGTTASNSFEFDAFKLQVEEVTLTVPASASQPAQAQTPNQTAGASSTSAGGQPAMTSSTVEAA
jgi:hypothetical protein